MSHEPCCCSMVSACLLSPINSCAMRCVSSALRTGNSRNFHRNQLAAYLNVRMASGREDQVADMGRDLQHRQ